MPIPKKCKILVQLSGMNGARGIMFDRYAGNNKTELDPRDKMYFGPDGTTLVLPSENIMSFLSAENTESAAKTLFDSRQYKKITRAIKAAVIIEEDLIPFKRSGNDVLVGDFDDDGIDPESGVRLVHHVARLAKGIPNPKVRPLLATPWELNFTIHVMPSKDLDIKDLKRLFEDGGVCVGLGTFRPVFGKFALTKFDIK